MRLTSNGYIRMSLKEARQLKREWDKVKSSISGLEMSILLHVTASIGYVERDLKAMDAGIMEKVAEILIEAEEDFDD